MGGPAAQGAARGVQARAHALHRQRADHHRPDPGRVRQEPPDGDRGDLRPGDGDEPLPQAGAASCSSRSSAAARCRCCRPRPRSGCPRAIVGIIAPWNFPFATGISDSISALMAGNGIVLKPDNKTALSPLYGVQMLEEAGLPRGLFQVVCGEGPDVGPALIDHANYVMFTGSTATGRVIGERAGRNLIGACLELGGKNPMIVLEDANLDEVVQGAMFGAFGNTGQICMHIERMYLPASKYDEIKRPARGGHRGAEPRGVVRLRAGCRLAGLAGPQGPRAVARRGRRREGRHGAHRRPGAPGPRPGVLRADDPRGRHQGHARRRHRDLRPGRRAAPVLDRRRGHRAGQRHRLRPQRLGVGRRRRRTRARSAAGSSPATSTSTTSSPRRSPRRARRPAA